VLLQQRCQSDRHCAALVVRGLRLDSRKLAIKRDAQAAEHLVLDGEAILCTETITTFARAQSERFGNALDVPERAAMPIIGVRMEAVSDAHDRLPVAPQRAGCCIGRYWLFGHPIFPLLL